MVCATLVSEPIQKNRSICLYAEGETFNFFFPPIFSPPPFLHPSSLSFSRVFPIFFFFFLRARTSSHLTRISSNFRPIFLVSKRLFYFFVYGFLFLLFSRKLKKEKRIKEKGDSSYLFFFLEIGETLFPF